MTTFSSLVFGIVYIICMFICFFLIFLYERIVKETSPEVLYDNETIGWIFVASIIWPAVLVAFIVCALWNKIIKKVFVNLIETSVSKINH